MSYKFTMLNVQTSIKINCTNLDFENGVGCWIRNCENGMVRNFKYDGNESWCMFYVD